MSGDPPAPRRSARELIATRLGALDAAEADIVEHLKNALDSSAHVVRSVLLRLALEQYNAGLRETQRARPEIAAAYLAVLERKVERHHHWATVSAAELMAALAARGVVGTAGDVREVVRAIGLPLEPEEEETR